MQVLEKTHHINANINGAGIDKILRLIIKNFPNAIVSDNDCEDNEYVEWDTTELSKEIRLKKTPGSILRAYRERAGLSLTDVAKKTGMKYTNISAMEHDSRVIGLSAAKRLAVVLHCDYTRFV
jgi:antitoxin component HigA of HigAB toxin-antitoxin module